MGVKSLMVVCYTLNVKFVLSYDMGVKSLMVVCYTLNV